MLDHGPDDERTDADGELAQPKRRLVARERVVRSRDDPNAAAHDFSVHPCNDWLWAARDRENDAGEAHEELFSRAGVANRHELVERRAGAERRGPVTPEHDDADVGAPAKQRDSAARSRNTDAGSELLFGCPKQTSATPSATNDETEPVGASGACAAWR